MKSDSFYDQANEADHRTFMVFDGHLVHKVDQTEEDVDALISLVDTMSDDDKDHMRFCAILVPALVEMASETKLFYREGIRGEYAAWTAYSIMKFLSRAGAFRGRVSEPATRKRWFGLAPDQWYITMQYGDVTATLDAKVK